MQVPGPYGFRPIGILGQEYNTNGFSDYPLITNNAVAISVGDPVALIANSIVPTTAAPSNALSANTPLGIAWGFTYTDTMNKIWETPYLPANAVTLGYTAIFVKVVDDPRALMYIQPLAPLPPPPAPIIGQNASFKNWGANGQKNSSIIALDQTSLQTGAALPLRIIRVDNASDPYPDVVVIWNFGIHAYQIGGTQ